MRIPLCPDGEELCEGREHASLSGGVSGPAFWASTSVFDNFFLCVGLHVTVGIIC